MIVLTLSRRNLVSLLHKLEMPVSARTIVKDSDDGEAVFIQVKPDEEVYVDRPPGRMHPETEAFMARLDAAMVMAKIA